MPAWILHWLLIREPISAVCFPSYCFHIKFSIQINRPFSVKRRAVHSSQQGNYFWSGQSKGRRYHWGCIYPKTPSPEIVYVLYIYCVRLKVFAYTQYTHCIHRFIGGFEGFILSTSSFSSMLAGNLFAWKLRHSTSIARVTLRKRLLAAKKQVTHLTRDTFQSTSSELTKLLLWDRCNAWLCGTKLIRSPSYHCLLKQ